MKNSRKLSWAVMTIMILMAPLFLMGCASLGGPSFENFDAEKIRALYEQSLLKVEAINLALASVDDLNVGGNGDSVISWILGAGIVAVGIASTHLGAKRYETVLRPRRIAKQQTENTQKTET